MRALALALFLAMLLPLAGCARSSRTKGDRDPVQPVNRGVYKFNDGLDRWIMTPIANGYIRVFPKPVRKGVSNFFRNLGEPNNFLNNELQGKPVAGLSDLGRFVINTTIGIVGLIDVATPIGLKRHEEDFGQTLGVWGCGEGPYLVIPLQGPSTLRDVPGIIVSSALKGLIFFPAGPSLTRAIDLVEAVDKRASADTQLKAVDDAAVDRYIYIRDAYRQHRIFLIYDGDPPLPPMPDDFYGDDSEDDAAESPAPSPAPASATPPAPATTPAPTSASDAAPAATPTPAPAEPASTTKISVE